MRKTMFSLSLPLLAAAIFLLTQAVPAECLTAEDVKSYVDAAKALNLNGDNLKARCANFCTAYHPCEPRHTARRDRRCAFVFRFARSARKFRRTIDNALCHERRNMDGTRNICDDGIVLTIDFFVVVLSLTRSIYFFYSNFQVVINEYKRTIRRCT